MITNTGKAILSKYLIGQTPSYASHIAVGCGATPLSVTDPSNPNFSDKTSLDFEMFRVPITSRGYVNIDGTPQIVLTAELPTSERYEITEVGLYPSAYNTIAGNTDSKVLYAFSTTEEWQHHTFSDNRARTIPSITSALDGGDNVISVKENDKELTAFQTNSDNQVFKYLDRVKRYENCRFYNNIIAIRGDDSALGFFEVTDISCTTSSITYVTAEAHGLNISDKVFVNGVVEPYGSFNTGNSSASVIAVTSNSFTITKTLSQSISLSSLTGVYMLIDGASNFNIRSGSNHIHITNTKINLNNNGNDELRVAFSIINKVGKLDDSFADSPQKVRLLIEFKSSESDFITETLQYANFEVELIDGVDGVSFQDNRYYVRSIPLDDLKKSINFSWSSIDVVKISATVIENNLPSSNFYVLLDAIRLENTTTKNPLYGLVGYTKVRTQNAETIIKEANTNTYVEFRFGFE